jgi:hydrogenase maturation protein HypF
MGELRSGRRIRLRGLVQGVGFRPWVYRLAREAGLDGRVRNDLEGVTVEVFGSEGALGRFVEALGAAPPPAARIREMSDEAIPAEPVRGFAIVASRASGERRVSIPPDLATCPQCLAEVADPGDRRFGHAFANCTNCGPRFSIAHDVPYDRSRTTMARFEMCAACRSEYEDVDDRRFHAQPISCPQCGPRAHDSGCSNPRVRRWEAALRYRPPPAP